MKNSPSFSARPRTRISRVLALAAVIAVLCTPLSSLAHAATPGVALVVTARADRLAAVPLAGRSVWGKVYVFATAPKDVTRIDFFVDNTAMRGTPVNSESTAPFDLVRVATKVAQPLDTTKLTNANHTVTMRVTRGRKVETSTTTFAVKNTTTPAPAPAPGPKPTPTPVPSNNPRQALYNERGGFAFGVTGGGLTGPTCAVTNLNDSGSGSLRACAESSSPQWTEFRVSGTIRLRGSIQVKSNKTLDARGKNVTISGAGLQMANSSPTDNIIITGFTFKDTGSADQIQLFRNWDNIWVHRNTFFKSADGNLDATGTLAHNRLHRLTVSWNRFENTGKTLLVNPDPAKDLNTHNDQLRLTIHHNFFNRVDSRAPRCLQAKCDLYNNFVYQWGGQAGQSHANAQTHAEANIFEARGDTLALSSHGDPKHTTGHVRSVGNVVRGGAKIEVRGTVFNPATYYRRVVEPATATLQGRLTGLTGAAASGKAL